MKRIALFLSIAMFCVLLFGCAPKTETSQIVATTLPVYEFSKELCKGTELKVTQLITEDISCLHDYTLQVSQMQKLENAEVLIVSGAGLETFLEDVATETPTVIDASKDIALISANCEHEDHHHKEDADPHYWLSPNHAAKMCKNICSSLSEIYPEYTSTFATNQKELDAKFNQLNFYAEENLKNLSCRQIITFHDGFQYMAEAFDLEIVHALEEESGREASAGELIALTEMIEQFQLPAIFTEKNGSTSAASVIASETDVNIFSLDMAMSADSYFTAMYHNIDTLKEALG